MAITVSVRIIEREEAARCRLGRRIQGAVMTCCTAWGVREAGVAPHSSPPGVERERGLHMLTPRIELRCKEKIHLYT